MEETSLNHQQLQEFQCALYSDEKSSAIIRKYRHDVEAFFQYAQGRPVTKELVVSYSTIFWSGTPSAQRTPCWRR